MKQRFRVVLMSAVLLAPTVLSAGERATPPLPDPIQGEPAGFLERFLELLREFVAGLVGSASV